MRLVRLISDLRLTELRLNRAVRVGAPLDHTLGMTRHATDLMDRIEALTPACEGELRIKADFFLHRARHRTAGPMAFRDLAIALDLMEQRNTRRPSAKKAMAGHERQAISRALSRSADMATMRTLVDQAGVRCSLYDTEHNVVGFSRPNALFYTRHRDQVLGRHITTLVGEHRYTVRARRKMDAALGGTAQLYTYPLDMPGVGLRVMECEMTPLRESDGRAAAILMMVDDVTDGYAI